VRALSFLQTEVSSAVDHSSTDEAALFRSLLTHLLNPTVRSRPIIPGSGARRQGHGHGQNHQHQEGSRKRTRSEDDWTNRLSGESDEDVDMNGAGGSNGVTTLTIEEDPLERSSGTPFASISTSALASTPNSEPSPGRHDLHSASGLVASVTAPTSTDQPPAPSPVRFKQRVEVFEALLEFINENAREPSGNLLDCINVIGEF